MRMSEKGRRLLLEQIEAMTKGENVQSARVLRDNELDFASGGISFNYRKDQPSAGLRYMEYKMSDVIVT